MGDSCGPLPYWQPATAKVIQQIMASTWFIYGILLLLGLVGNACTCAVIWRTRHLRTATNYYLFSLAVSDALMLAAGVPFEFHQVMGPWYPYEGADFLCVFKAYMIEWTGYASVLTITAFSFERWMAICFPMKMQLFSKFTRAIKIIIGIWVASAMAASPVFALVHMGLPVRGFQKAANASERMVFFANETIQDANNIQYLRGTRYCAIDSAVLGSHVLIYTAFTAFFLLPLITISVLYTHILWATRGSASDVHKPSDLQNISRARKTRKSLIKMLMVVVLAFFVCWLPYHLQRIISMNETLQSIPQLAAVNRVLFYVSGYFYYANSAVNPVIYNVLSRRFRKAFLRLMCPHRLASALKIKLGNDTMYYTANSNINVRSCQRSQNTARVAHLARPQPHSNVSASCVSNGTMRSGKSQGSLHLNTTCKAELQTSSPIADNETSPKRVTICRLNFKDRQSISVENSRLLDRQRPKSHSARSSPPNAMPNPPTRSLTPTPTISIDWIDNTGNHVLCREQSKSTQV